MSVTQIKSGSSDNQLIVNSDGSINVNSSGGGGSGNVTIVNGANTASVSAAGALEVGLAGLATFQTGVYSVGVTAVQITPTPLSARSAISLKAVCATGTAIYIGNASGVTIATGYPLFNGDSIQLDILASQAIFAISTVSNTLYALEIG